MARPPTVDTWLRDSCKFEIFFGGEAVGRGSDSSPPDLLADGKEARCAALPKNPTPVSALRATSPCAPNFEILATPLVSDLVQNWLHKHRGENGSDLRRDVREHLLHCFRLTRDS